MSVNPVRVPPSPSGSGESRPGFTPLSEQLLQIVNSDDGADITLNQLLARTTDRGPYGLIILLCLPFMTPVSLPGVSNVFGVVIILLAWRIMQGKPARLPRRIGERSIEGKILAKVIRASIRVLRFIEGLTKPRGSAWVRSVSARRFNAGVLIFGGLLLAAPIPPIIPLSNLTPAVGIILIAASMMEEDGLVVWFGYGATFAATAYIGTLIYLQSAFVVKLWHQYSDAAAAYLRDLFS